MSVMNEALAAHMLVVCGPSGVGKSSLVARVLDRFETASLSVSYTTRERREHEIGGTHYHFVTRDRFESLVATDHFAEWAEVHGNLYGTPTDAIREAQERDRDLLFDIDYQGAGQLRARFPTCWAVLVTPPDMQQLEARLRGRATETEDSISRRLGAARHELAQVGDFDFVIRNDDIDRAVEEITAVYVALRLRRVRHRAEVDRLVRG